MALYTTDVIKAMFPLVVKSDLPGRLRLAVGNYPFIPGDMAAAFMRPIGSAMGLLPGVQSVTVNMNIGTLLVLYDPVAVSKEGIFAWIDVLIGEGAAYAAKHSGALDVDAVERHIMDRLKKRKELKGS